MPFMAIIGWLTILGVMLVASMGWGALAVFSLGTYTIGGARNSQLKKVFVLALGLVLAAGWWFLVFKQAPFTVSMK